MSPAGSAAPEPASLFDELMAEVTAASEHATPDFGAFIDRHPALLDKRLLTRFYRSTTLAGPQARTGWVEPDLVAFPWQGSDH
ncbi:hypothetical protein [Actinomadura livida]|uniref:Uncharacterized protein n=1 Tax=Actinomadura livida TaxID=79909 RepID=A0A7W7I7V1_9ACTN|nr:MULTISPECIES: hypothetical protein [Actinomadura]MBB4772089.1 hypothetical protein [Actinomadura catellatispora]GGU39556.1 hypothetical protein GCM10010208_74750 [Actinomadura livida]